MKKMIPVFAQSVKNKFKIKVHFWYYSAFLLWLRCNATSDLCEFINIFM